MAVSDIAFVCSKDKCPPGYEILSKTNTGHPANLWKKFIGAPAEERYLCFTKESSKDGKIIEDMYIPGSSERYVMKGYEVVKRTIEREESLNCKYLAIKRTARADAKTAVIDIRIYKAKVDPPDSYRKLGAKLNGLYICIKIVPVDDIPVTTTKTGVPAMGPSSPTGPPPTAVSRPPPTSVPTNPLPTSSYQSNQQQQQLSSQYPPAGGPPPTTNPYTSEPPSFNSGPPPTTNSRSSFSGPSSSTNPYTSEPSYNSGPPPTNSPYTSGSSYNSGPPPTTNPYTSGPSYNSGPPPTSYPPPSDPMGGSYDQSNRASMRAGSVRHNNPRDTTRRSIPNQPSQELLLGFEHLDLDQPIEFDQNGREFEETPPDSPVQEHITMEESFDVDAAPPLPPSSTQQPTPGQYQPNQPYFNQPNYSSGTTYPPPPGGLPYNTGYPPNRPSPYNTGPLTRGPPPYNPGPPPGTSQYYTGGPPGGPQYQTGPYTSGYNTQGYPPPYNPAASGYQPRPSPQSGGSSNIGFNI